MRQVASAEGPQDKGSHVDGHQKLLVDLCGILHIAIKALMINYGHKPTRDMRLGRVTYNMPLGKNIRLDEGWDSRTVRGPSWIIEKYPVTKGERFWHLVPGTPEWQPETSKEPSAVEIGVRVRWPKQFKEESSLWINSAGEADLGGPGFEGVILNRTHQLVGATAFAAVIRQKAVIEIEGLGPLPQIRFERINQALERSPDGEWAIEHAKQHHLEVPAELTGYTGTVWL